MIETPESSGGVSFAVRVQPRASRNTVLGEQASALKMAVTAVPEDGKANAAVIESLAEMFAVPRASITIVAGRASRNKTVRIGPMTAEQVSSLLNRVIEEE